MKKSFLSAFTLLFFNHCFGQQEFQLASPILKYNSVFFTTSAIATLKFAQPGTQIFYTLNNKEPTQQNASYSKPITIKKSFTTLKAKVFGNGFLPSETVQVTFIKDGLKIKSTEQSSPNEKFPGNGTKTLFDNEGGIADLHNKNFLGYQQDSVEINLTLEKKQAIQSVLLDFLQDHGSWIFLPQEIEVYYFNDTINAYQFFAKKTITDTVNNGNATIFEIIKGDKKINTAQLKIIIEPLQSMPEGHPGKGKQSWIFIDEIKIY